MHGTIFQYDLFSLTLNPFCILINAKTLILGYFIQVAIICCSALPQLSVLRDIFLAPLHRFSVLLSAYEKYS